MKKFPIIILIILLFTGCTKKDPDNTLYTTNDYQLFIKNNRIIEKNYLVNDAVRSRTKYYFNDTLVKVVFYGQDTLVQEKYILYKIGENGYAESSIEYPEPVSYDSSFMSRKHYIYNSFNQLITVKFENHTPYGIYLETLFTYTYNGENIAGSYTRDRYSGCEFQITYESSDITSKIDILNFTNGILGKTNTKLIKHIKEESSGFCDPHNSATMEYEMTYTLDDQGYVIQSRQSRNDQSDSSSPNTETTYTTINNYDIRFLD